MKARIWTLVTEVFVILTLSISSTAQARQQPEQPVRFIVKNLGTLGGALGTAFGINNQGWITGSSNLAGDRHQHAFLWYSAGWAESTTTEESRTAEVHPP